MTNHILRYSLNRWRYRQLFAAIILLFLFVSFVTFPMSGLITSCLLTLTIFLMLRTITIAVVWQRGLLGLITIALVCSLANAMVQDPLLSHSLAVFSDGVYAIFLSCTILILAKQLNQTQQIDADILIGAICVYLLMGIFWFLLYRINYTLDSNNFTKVLDNTNFQLLYFSFTTLTTLGYGDITPTGSAVMGLTNLEAIVGQMYPAIFVARLVSLYAANVKE